MILSFEFIRKNFLILLSFLILTEIQSQELVLGPYLQDAEPTSIAIFWETSEGEETIVEFGLTEALGSETEGVSYLNTGTRRLHIVQLSDLTPFTTYYYKTVTGEWESEIFLFKTPPSPDSEEPFRIVAMSDMQRDYTNPDKFEEIIHDGIFPYFEENYEGELHDELGMVLIAGDLVDIGNNLNEWEEHFFGPSAPLFSQVPIYPVPGNHELNALNFWNYFQLPLNGSEGSEEHWWFKDYSNVRIIGLDSNWAYQTDEQLDWLQALLAETCTANHIDFVFVELHHPHVSELWITGETDYSSEVVSLLENFSTSCGKPSVHFFGHTHGYARGQSRDHKHVMVNVATGGGAIDYWGDFIQADREEISVSQDEWGFVVMEIEAGDDPKFQLRRISQGDELLALNNVQQDSILVKFHGTPPSQPMPVFPLNVVISPECIILEGTPFEDDDALHGASHWQVSTDCMNFTEPVYESWKNHENWYFDTNSQADDDLTNELVNSLEPMGSYCWRVRYRDRGLEWSEWSEPQAFNTGLSTNGESLLTNGDAESGIEDWEVTEGIFESIESFECDAIEVYEGTHSFCVGGVCLESAYAEVHQLRDVSIYSEEIDAGEFFSYHGGYMSDFNGNDLPEMQVFYLDESQVALDSTERIGTLNPVWTYFEEVHEIPPLTRYVDLRLFGTRNSGTDNDCYFDELFLKVGNNFDCNNIISVNELKPSSECVVYPNPFTDIITFEINEQPQDLKILIYDMMGKKLLTKEVSRMGNIQISGSDLQSKQIIYRIVNNGATVCSGTLISN